MPSPECTVLTLMTFNKDTELLAPQQGPAQGWARADAGSMG